MPALGWAVSEHGDCPEPNRARQKDALLVDCRPHQQSIRNPALVSSPESVDLGVSTRKERGSPQASSPATASRSGTALHKAEPNVATNVSVMPLPGLVRHLLALVGQPSQEVAGPQLLTNLLKVVLWTVPSQVVQALGERHVGAQPRQPAVQEGLLAMGRKILQKAAGAPHRHIPFFNSVRDGFGMAISGKHGGG